MTIFPILRELQAHTSVCVTALFGGLRNQKQDCHPVQSQDGSLAQSMVYLAD